MATEIITKEDLKVFRLELLRDLKELLAEKGPSGPKEWLKNGEVCRLLKISRTTLQRFRVAGKLKSTKIGGVHYYLLSEVEGLMNHPG
jgi:hypothetical protein